MLDSNTNISHDDQVWQRYEDNFSRDILGVARYLQSVTMHTLQQDCNHQNLRMGFAPYITLVGLKGKRLSDLAGLLNISRQACNQAINQIETAGYITREADPSDGRAKQLVLTDNGIRLRSDGANVVAKIDKEFAEIVGTAAIEDAICSLGKLHTGLGLMASADIDAGLYDASLGGLLPRLADHTLQRLMDLTRAKGHPGLKLSFGQVLTLIGHSGGRIQYMAAINDVSKQAISAIATELETLGYLHREPDPADARQVVLHFSERGRVLITDSVDSVSELEAEFIAIAGVHAIQSLKATFRRLYRGLHLEKELDDGSAGVNISLLAKQLQKQLGVEGSQTLARLLLNPTNTQR